MPIPTNEPKAIYTGVEPKGSGSFVLNQNDKGYVTKHSYNKENERSFYPLHWKGYCTRILDTDFTIIKNFKMATKQTTPTAEFKNILLKDIEADINQPRKFFDEHSLVELAASVKANGVLQPIMVRPKGKKYLLVYGERRFKAAFTIGLKEIPAIIRELTDAEALDIQITENLQRKDVHPMEEAVGFKRLLETFSTEDIALRVGKSESFVAKRIQLTELVEDAQQIFFLNKFTISQAIKLSRLDKDVQQEVINQVLPDDWKEDADFDFNEFQFNRYIDNKQFSLDNAIFSLKEKTLYKEAGACVGCKFNSASTPLLFDEEEDTKQVCLKPSCFQIKTDRQEKNNLETLAVDPTKIVVCPNNSLSDDGKRKVEIAREMGINVLDRKDYDLVSVPDEIMFFDKWKEKWYCEDEDDTEDNIQSQYNEYVEDLKEEYKQYENLVASGSVVKAVNVFTLQEVTIRITGSVKNDVDAATGNAGHNETKEEIEKIENREARAKELDAEKVWTEIRALLSTKENQQTIYCYADLSDLEIKAFGVAILSSLGYHTKQMACKLLSIEDANTFKFDTNDINALAKILVVDKLVSAFGSHINGEHNAIAYEVLKNYLPTDIAKIELEQQVITEARGERVEKRIKALKEKLIMN